MLEQLRGTAKNYVAVAKAVPGTRIADDLERVRAEKNMIRLAIVL